MPLKRSTYGDWEIIKADPDIVAKHQETGATITITKDGDVIVNSLTTTEP